jgi:hypothetical protein
MIRPHRAVLQPERALERDRSNDHVAVTADMLVEVGDGETEVLPLEQPVNDYLSLTDHRPVRSWLRWGS